MNQSQLSPLNNRETTHVPFKRNLIYERLHVCIRGGVELVDLLHKQVRRDALLPCAKIILHEFILHIDVGILCQLPALEVLGKRILHVLGDTAEVFF